MAAPKKTKWTIDKIKLGFESFFAANGRYPTSAEIDNYPKLPSSRQIQRRYGGLPALRKELKLKGPENFTKGEYSSKRAFLINRRFYKLENDVYKFLADRYTEPFVQREYFFTDDRRNRADFYIYCENGNFCVDIFYPKDRRSLATCLNSKLRTFKQDQSAKFPVIFVMMNENISAEVIEDVLGNKKIKLKSNQMVLTYEEFKKFCLSKKPRKIDHK